MVRTDHTKAQSTHTHVNMQTRRTERMNKHMPLSLSLARALTHHCGPLLCFAVAVPMNRLYYSIFNSMLNIRFSRYGCCYYCCMAKHRAYLSETLFHSQKHHHHHQQRKQTRIRPNKRAHFILAWVCALAVYCCCCCWWWLFFFSLVQHPNGCGVSGHTSVLQQSLHCVPIQSYIPCSFRVA